jgi:dTMP kinase
MRNGLLITFEGIDKVGKSTQVEKLLDYFISKGHEPVLVREPGSTAISERIRSILADPALKGKISPLTEFFLYSASRAQLVTETIEPGLRANKIVIADRYYDSSSAYQGFGRGIPLGNIEAVNKIASHNIKPDLTILLYINEKSPRPHKSINRLAPNLFDDRTEQEFLLFRQNVQDGFQAIAQKEKDRFLVLDASESKDQIFKKIKSRIDKLLKTFTSR